LIVSDKKNLFVFSGNDVDITWDKRLCIHVQECVRAKGELFVTGRKPWGDPDVTDADSVAEVVSRCPTGALTYRRKDGGEGETAPHTNRVVIANNGPLYVSGRLEIDGVEDDMPGVNYRAALCRCGQSKAKPFCDNSHEEAGFVDRAALGETGPGLEEQEGTLAITGAPDGPLLLTGPHTIVTGAGREGWSGTKSALCRCGASENKPFCDGSHKEVGFKSE
jgi:CDGSH-type Zn-finger protein/uncharacterized Fe-S cluster protein YjdI